MTLGYLYSSVNYSFLMCPYKILLRTPCSYKCVMFIIICMQIINGYMHYCATPDVTIIVSVSARL